MSMVTTETLPEVPLTALDRCDRCGASAKVRATMLAGEILFCGHHAKKAIDALRSSALAIYDPESVCS